MGEQIGNRYCWQRSFHLISSNPPPDFSFNWQNTCNTYISLLYCWQIEMTALKKNWIGQGEWVNFFELSLENYLKSGAIPKVDMDASQILWNEYRSGTYNKAWMQSSAETTDSCWIHLGLCSLLYPQSICYRNSVINTDLKGKTEFRNESSRTYSAVLVQIKGNCHITKLGKKKMKKKDSI